MPFPLVSSQTLRIEYGEVYSHILSLLFFLISFLGYHDLPAFGAILPFSKGLLHQSVEDQKSCSPSMRRHGGCVSSISASTPPFALGLRGAGGLNHRRTLPSVLR
ncbi:hypothetical protein K470DRAFT_153657 [Piedraia hortae CBS 480.64]|uniref:Uncharacterized protein n=1 Tax=Piedraia hortae CBS 480.64 TaxID=1314780 RepID=A0A6A7C6R2_9PEZI|nr:hypothetical protein K470DRAFT_153657 [Piedraia hortae CBS 480.64]